MTEQRLDTVRDGRLTASAGEAQQAALVGSGDVSAALTSPSHEGVRRRSPEQALEIADHQVVHRASHQQDRFAHLDAPLAEGCDRCSGVHHRRGRFPAARYAHHPRVGGAEIDSE